MFRRDWNRVVTGLLAAERERLRRGRGQCVDLNLKDPAAAMLGNLGIIGEVAVSGESRAKHGNALYGAYGQDFTTACGSRVMVIALTTRQWRLLLRETETAEAMTALAERLGTDLSTEAARWHARADITAVLAPWFAARRVVDFAKSFDAAGVTWSVFRSFAPALSDDPDLSAENPLFSDLYQPGIGRYLTPGSPFVFGNHARRAPVAAPTLGQHTEEILADVARLPETEIASLFDAGVVARPSEAMRMAS